jgi:DNA-binding SARP family transcriptional activator
VLAALLVHASQVVSTHRPIDELWGEAPPPTARNVLQCHVSRLRRALHHSHDRGAPAQILSTQQHGYLLRVEPGQLDLHRFEELLAQARSASAEQDYEQARPGSCEPDGPGARFGNSHPGPDIYTV